VKPYRGNIETYQATIKIFATTRSNTTKGIKSKNPIWNAVFKFGYHKKQGSLTYYRDFIYALRRSDLGELNKIMQDLFLLSVLP